MSIEKQPNPFKVGDRVRCVRVDAFCDTYSGEWEYSPRSDLEVGKEYVVTRLNGADIVAEDDFYSSASHTRFELVASSSAVHRPNHYTRWKIEPIKFIEENGLPFAIGNIIKYVMRYDAKDGLQDLKKAARYLEMLIKRLEGDPEWNA